MVLEGAVVGNYRKREKSNITDTKISVNDINEEESSGDDISDDTDSDSS